ncbi:ATP-grasp domain-containing protein [Streptomyces sp. YH02]|uniref:ATP-grasp domain-containing protein n=1 Tax=Streptomyces sp. YH02 TaxID=3256999 RepID=UPI0037573C2C
MSTQQVVFVESNTTGTGREFARQVVLLGMEPVLITADADRYSYVREDAVRYVVADTADPAAVLEAVHALESAGEVVGVTSSSEYYVGTAALTARELGLSGPSAESIQGCRNKATQRRRLAEAGVPGPRFAVAESVQEAAAAAEGIGFPVVVKPVQGSGSLGVRLCADAGQLEAHARELLGASVNERGLAAPAEILVEEYLRGREFSVEVFDGRAVVAVAKHVGPLPSFVEIGHDVPAALPESQERQLMECAVRATEALGTTWGAAHVELRMDDRGPRIVEVNPRLAGGMIPVLVTQACGIDLVRAQVNAVVGRREDVAPGHARTASIRFLTADRAGTLGKDSEVTAAVAEALTVDGVVDTALYRAPGERVSAAEDFRDRIGHVIAVAEALGQSGQSADAGLRSLRGVLRHDEMEGVR